MNVTGDPGDCIREIDKVRAAIASLTGKTITVNVTDRARYEEITGEHFGVDQMHPSPNRRMSFKDSVENIRRRFSNAIKRLGEL
jgi:hypothetical protein